MLFSAFIRIADNYADSLDLSRNAAVSRSSYLRDFFKPFCWLLD